MPPRARSLRPIAAAALAIATLLPAAGPAGAADWSVAAGLPTASPALAARSVAPGLVADVAAGLLPVSLLAGDAASTFLAAPAPAAASSPAPPPRSASAARTVRPASSHATPTYRGTNHVWIPGLGINRSVTFSPCSSTTPPANLVYRWGCAGANNVYLFGHAYSVFKPLHDAYVSGRLHKGLKVIYADGAGRVRTYTVAWWRVTTPDNGGFAYAAQSRPSLTLQTCLGSRSQYRLIVRLVAA